MPGPHEAATLALLVGWLEAALHSDLPRQGQRPVSQVDAHEALRQRE